MRVGIGALLLLSCISGYCVSSVVVDSEGRASSGIGFRASHVAGKGTEMHRF